MDALVENIEITSSLLLRVLWNGFLGERHLKRHEARYIRDPYIFRVWQQLDARVHQVTNILAVGNEESGRCFNSVATQYVNFPGKDSNGSSVMEAAHSDIWQLSVTNMNVLLGFGGCFWFVCLFCDRPACLVPASSWALSFHLLSSQHTQTHHLELALHVQITCRG